MNGRAIRRMMRVNKVTIAVLAQRMSITQIRVRQVRAQGVFGYQLECDWIVGITGVNVYRMVA